MSKSLTGAISRTQHTDFVSPYFENSSPLGKCLKAVSEPVNRDVLRSAKGEMNTLLAQVADALDVIAERENLAHQNPSNISYSDGGQVGSATDLMAALLRLSIDMNSAIDRKLEGGIMSEFSLLGVYLTPLEACDATGVKYEEKGRSEGFTRLNLIHGGKGDASIRTFADGRGGIVFNHRGKTMAVWFDDYKDGHELTETQKRKLKAEMEAARRQAEAVERAKHERAAFYAMQFYRNSSPVTKDHYLKRKHVKPTATLRSIPYAKAFDILKAYYLEAFGYTPVGFLGKGGTTLKADKDLLLVPMRGDVSHVQTIQLIDETGAKAFLCGGKKKGAYWQSEKLPEFDPDATMTIGIGEGVATVLGVKQVKSFPVVAAMDCGNLKPVALEIRARFPKAKILILSDVGKGEKEAFEAAQACGGELVIPKFTDTLTAHFKALTGKDNPTDFNDYYLAKEVI